MPNTPQPGVGLVPFAKSNADPFAELMQAIRDESPLRCINCWHRQMNHQACEMCGATAFGRIDDAE